MSANKYEVDITELHRSGSGDNNKWDKMELEEIDETRA